MGLHHQGKQNFTGSADVRENAESRSLILKEDLILMTSRKATCGTFLPAVHTESKVCHM
jgi:hypothetical protein